jgi:hypothetical protein
MRIIAFPSDESTPDQTWLHELDAALNGLREGTDAHYWCELRGDVRALAPAMDAEFARCLENTLQAAPRSSGRVSRGRGWLTTPMRFRVAAVAGTAIAVLAAVAIVASMPSRPVRSPLPKSSGAVRASSGQPSPTTSSPAAGAANSRADEAPAPSPQASSAGAAEGGKGVVVPQTRATSPPGREQQLAASISLSVPTANVQAISDGVSRLAVHEEGYVEDSHTQVQQHGPSEANLTLSLPSARLSAALAAIAQLAPVSAESQSLQDITNTYNAARQRLTEALAEQQALLRALAHASTEGQIDSLRERLAQARTAVAHAQSTLRAVSRRASTAEVEVTVVGGANLAGEGTTLHHGLHDAGRVLTVALIVMLIAAAVLVPLAVVLAVLFGAARLWRRYARERALDVT